MSKLNRNDLFKDIINSSIDMVIQSVEIVGRLLVAAANIAYAGDIPSANRNFEESLMLASNYLAD